MTKFKIENNWLIKTEYKNCANNINLFEAIRIDEISRITATKSNIINFLEKDFKYYIYLSNQIGSTIEFEYELTESSQFNSDLLVLKELASII